MEILKLNGPEAQKFLRPLAELRLSIFWEYPYLYEGSLSYEEKYLATYFNCAQSFILLLKDEEKIVGATTAIIAEAEEDNFKKAFIEQNLNPQEGVYFGESLLLPQYRGQGFGKIFFQERELFAKSLNRKWVSFCSVVRENHPLCPPEYQGYESMWSYLGYSPLEGMTTYYEWKDRDQNQPSKKLMQYWFKNFPNPI